MSNEFNEFDDLDVADAEFDNEAFDDYWADAVLERCNSCGAPVSDDEIDACPDAPLCYDCMGLEG